MNYLLDTHTVLWFLGGDQQIPAKVVSEIENPDNKIFVSIGSIWEIAIKMSLGKLVYKDGFESLVQLIGSNGFEILQLSVEHLAELKDLEFIHRDPFDRLLIAQTRHEGLTLITKDSLIQRYPVSILW